MKIFGLLLVILISAPASADMFHCWETQGGRVVEGGYHVSIFPDRFDKYRNTVQVSKGLGEIVFEEGSFAHKLSTGYGFFRSTFFKSASSLRVEFKHSEKVGEENIGTLRADFLSSPAELVCYKYN